LKCNHVLIVEDTTELNFSWRKTKIEGLGPINRDGNQGFYLHPSIIVNPVNESVLGLASAHLWARNYGEKSTKNNNYKKKPIEERESYRWFMVPEEIQDYIKKDRTFTVVADREADIYELFLYHKQGKFGDNCDLLIRSHHNRAIINEDQRLHALIESWPVKGEYKIDIEPNHKREKRQANMEIRYEKVQLSIPIEKRKKYKNIIPEIYVIDVKEKSNLDSNELLHWTLLTTHEVNTVEDAKEKVNWYKCRWFKIWLQS
jgi:hypothetical protein